MWTETFTAPKDNFPYTIQVVGGNPFYNGARTTTVQVGIVPVIVTLPDGSVFDPTQPDPCSGSLSTIDAVLQSPIFQPYPATINGINIGVGQYIDEYQRSDFYSRVSLTQDKYHVTLAPQVLAPVSVTMQPGTGVSWALGGCTNLAGIDWPTFIPLMRQNFAAPILDPSRFTLFITRNAVTVQNGLSLANCCVYRWHGVPYERLEQADDLRHRGL